MIIISKRVFFYSKKHEKLTRDGSFDKSLHVIEAIKSGYNGTGIRVVVLDDGLEFKHEDIFPNYVRDFF